jgi:hypothetical protein
MSKNTIKFPWIFLVAAQRLNKFTMYTLNKDIKNPLIMKKVLLIASLLMTLTGMTFAQTTPKKAKAPKPAAAATASTTAKPAAGPTKKDGSADMRYKANKDAAKTAPAATHVKKDGTPDKRFKENKAPAAKKS